MGYGIENNAVAIEDTSTCFRDPCFNMIFLQRSVFFAFSTRRKNKQVQLRDVVPAKSHLSIHEIPRSLKYDLNIIRGIYLVQYDKLLTWKYRNTMITST